MDNVDSELVRLIERRRVALRPRVSREVAAERAGVSAGWWGKVVRGTSRPTGQTILDMARAVDMANEVSAVWRGQMSLDELRDWVDLSPIVQTGGAPRRDPLAYAPLTEAQRRQMTRQVLRSPMASDEEKAIALRVLEETGAWEPPPDDESHSSRASSQVEAS